MMKLACKDLNSDSTCDFVATDSSVKEVADKMMNHVKQDHMEDMKGMSDRDMRQMIESKVHE
jgi:predicted small metal-binding protein